MLSAAQQKKQEEQNIKKVRDLLRLPANRKCFDCPTKSPFFVNVSIQTFICSRCSGLVREVGHRVKSISASKFSGPEVLALQQGGNEKAYQIWLSNYGKDNLEPEADLEVRAFIRQKYYDQKWLDRELLMAHTNEVRGMIRKFFTEDGYLKPGMKAPPVPGEMAQQKPQQRPTSLQLTSSAWKPPADDIISPIFETHYHHEPPHSAREFRSGSGVILGAPAAPSRMTMSPTQSASLVGGVAAVSTNSPQSSYGLMDGSPPIIPAPLASPRTSTSVASKSPSLSLNRSPSTSSHRSMSISSPASVPRTSPVAATAMAAPTAVAPAPLLAQHQLPSDRTGGAMISHQQQQPVTTPTSSIFSELAGLETNTTKAQRRATYTGGILTPATPTVLTPNATSPQKKMTFPDAPLDPFKQPEPQNSSLPPELDPYSALRGLAISSKPVHESSKPPNLIPGTHERQESEETSWTDFSSSTAAGFDDFGDFSEPTVSATSSTAATPTNATSNIAKSTTISSSLFDDLDPLRKRTGRFC